MGADESAYAVLGLEPGADLASATRAYKALIKAHHPDRAGGDPERAAELNRAYREIRAAHFPRDDVSWHSVPPRKPPPGWSRGAWALAALAVLGGATAAFALLSPREAARIVGLDERLALRPFRADVMEQPHDLAGISAATLDAVGMAKVSDEMRLRERSSACYESFRKAPAIGQFDRCAAFDFAVVRLQDRDPLRDRGPFSEIAVTSRVSSAGSVLSRDVVATESRRRRTRLQVEQLLRPDEPSWAGR